MIDTEKLRDKILSYTNKFTSWHEKVFTYLASKSKTSLWFTLLLLIICIYEVIEHFIIPALLLWWAW